MLIDFFRYNDWANDKTLTLCADLTPETWDAPVAMGCGSLRATLHHILAADELWQDRLEGKPWRPLAAATAGISLAEFRDRYRAVAARRHQILNTEQADDYRRAVEYQNTERQSFSNELGDLLLHVGNHAVHHRAQVLNMARHHGRALPGGLDYLMYRLAHPTVAPTPAAVQLVRGWKLEIGEDVVPPLPFDMARHLRYARYGEWATDLLLVAANDLAPADWRRAHPIGPGSIAKTLAHLIDAERWWLLNFTRGPGPFPETGDVVSPAELRAVWHQLVRERRAWLSTQTADTLAEPVAAQVPGGELCFRRSESLLQLCAHGTHHRAQVVNMFRHSGIQLPPLDLIAWFRLGAPVPHPL